MFHYLKIQNHFIVHLKIITLKEESVLQLHSKMTVIYKAATYLIILGQTTVRLE